MNPNQARKTPKLKKIKLSERQKSLVIVGIIIVAFFAVMIGLYAFGYNNGYKTAEKKAQQAASKKSGMEDMLKAPNPFNTVSGKVVAVSKDKITIDSSKGERQELKLSANVKVTKKTQQLKVSDIKVDQTVVAFQSKQGDAQEVIRIVVRDK